MVGARVRGAVLCCLALVCLLAGVGVVAWGGGVRVAEAVGTTVEVDDATLVVGGNGSVDIWVRGFPAGAFGLGAYSIRVGFDPSQVEVVGVSPGNAPFNSPIGNILEDEVRITQFSTAWPGPTGDIRVADIEFTCIAEGQSEFALTVETLSNVNGDRIAATPVNGTVTQVSLVAETFAAQQQDPEDGVVVLPVGIVRVKNPVTGETVPGVHIGCYQARATYSPAGIQVLDVRPGDSPFDAPVVNINNAGGETSFAQYTVEGSEPPIDVARLVPRLVGCATDSYVLVVTFDVIGDTEGCGIPEEGPRHVVCQRGDIKADGVVNIIDAMFGAQYIVGHRPVQDISPLNMAGVHYDDGGGDVKDIIDCMFIAQYVVGIRDCHFDLAAQ